MSNKEREKVRQANRDALREAAQARIDGTARQDNSFRKSGWSGRFGHRPRRGA